MPKLAVVTGGTRGIGKSISLALKNDGYVVVANYSSNDTNANQFSQEHNIDIAKWDVADFQSCQENIQAIETKYGKKVSILVNNAGISRDGMLHKLDPLAWHEVINVNLSSCFNMCKAVIPSMREQQFGRIVNVSSINALNGRVGVTNYAAAKAGILGLTKSLAKESANKGITVNAVAPGYVVTELIANVPEQVIEKIISEIPVNRLGQPSEVARLVSFLISPESGFITGETISINGGHHMQ